jgi:hypothetical protein
MRPGAILPELAHVARITCVNTKSIILDPKEEEIKEVRVVMAAGSKSRSS